MLYKRDFSKNKQYLQSCNVSEIPAKFIMELIGHADQELDGNLPVAFFIQ